MALISVSQRISTVRLLAKACNPPLQSGTLPRDWCVISAALIYQKGLIRQLKAMSSSSVLGATDHQDHFPPLGYVGGIGHEEWRHWAPWNANLMSKSHYVFWKRRSCLAYPLKGCGDYGWRGSIGHFIHISVDVHIWPRKEIFLLFFTLVRPHLSTAFSSEILT